MTDLLCVCRSVRDLSISAEVRELQARRLNAGIEGHAHPQALSQTAIAQAGKAARHLCCARSSGAAYCRRSSQVMAEWERGGGVPVDAKVRIEAHERDRPSTPTASLLPPAWSSTLSRTIARTSGETGRGPHVMRNCARVLRRSGRLHPPGGRSATGHRQTREHRGGGSRSAGTHRPCIFLTVPPGM